jgi:aldose 1-epimerase
VTTANSQQFSIQARFLSRETSAEISSFGAALTGLYFDGVEVAGDPGSVGIASRYIGSTLAPWPNRIAAARWALAGHELKLNMNEPERNNALHGLVFDVDWQLRDLEPHSVTLGYLLEASAGYPFTLDLSVTYALTESGLEVTTRVENLSAEPAPFGLAFHPYFKVTSADAVLETSFAQFLETDENLIPTGESAALAKAGFNFDDEVDRINALEARLDHCFSSPRPGAIVTRLRAAGGTTTVWQDPVFGYCMVYTGTVGDASNLGYIAIEPQTMPADAFNTEVDLVWLTPSMPESYRWGVSFS